MGACGAIICHGRRKYSKDKRQEIGDRRQELEVRRTSHTFFFAPLREVNEKGVVVKIAQECHFDWSEERAEWRNLAFRVILLQNGKISPLQNLLRQIFPVEMTRYRLMGTLQSFQMELHNVTLLF